MQMMAVVAVVTDYLAISLYILIITYNQWFPFIPITIHIETVPIPFVAAFLMDHYFHRVIESSKKNYDVIARYFYFIQAISSIFPCKMLLRRLPYTS